jgi:hypothetical protein
MLTVGRVLPATMGTVMVAVRFALSRTVRRALKLPAAL